MMMTMTTTTTTMVMMTMMMKRRLMTLAMLLVVVVMRRRLMTLAMSMVVLLVVAVMMMVMMLMVMSKTISTSTTIYNSKVPICDYFTWTMRQLLINGLDKKGIPTIHVEISPYKRPNYHDVRTLFHHMLWMYLYAYILLIVSLFSVANCNTINGCIRLILIYCFDSLSEVFPSAISLLTHVLYTISLYQT